jgi:hypothetical protein
MTLSKVDLKIDPNTAHRADDADLQVRVYGVDADRVAYVVRAVNAHEALVAMLQRLVDEKMRPSLEEEIRDLLRSLR